MSPADLQKEIVAATGARQRNTETIAGFLSSKAGIDPAQVKTAAASLNNEELARLAARAEKAQADFAAGRISDRDLIYIILGIAVLILIIVAVH